MTDHNELKRQCALMLDMANDNISELEGMGEQEQRHADIRADYEAVHSLIAAAPDLLTALEQALSALEDIQNGGSLWHDNLPTDIQRTRAALAKAKAS